MNVTYNANIENVRIKKRTAAPMPVGAAVRFLMPSCSLLVFRPSGSHANGCSYSHRSWMVVRGGSQWDGSWKSPAGAGAMPTAVAGASAADMPRWYANRTQTWTSNLRGHYFAWDWTIPVTIATVVAITATLSSNSCKSTIVFDTFYFHSAKKDRHEWNVS